MDESPDHESTLIERGMGVHLNHPITARRETCNSRPARWELQTPRPPSRGGTVRGRTEKSDNSSRSPRMGPGSGARREATPPGYAPNVRERQHMCTAPPRPAEINASHKDDAANKTLKECHTPPRLRGLDLRVHQRVPTEQHNNQGEERPICQHQHLRDPNGCPADARGLLSGTALGVP
jgi:hypothetical protein